jgi:subtilisin family serine protease
MWLAGVLAALLWAAPAKAAGGGVIVRTTLGLQGLQALCLTNSCTVVTTALDGSLGQLFLVTTQLDPATLASTLSALPGIVDAEVNQLLSLIGGLNVVPTPISPTLMQDRSSVPYPANSTQTAWSSYVNQSAASIVGIQNAQKTFKVTGTGIVADIDTGVDPTHPVLQPVLVAGDGYDFTRNQAGGSELNDLSPCPFPSTSPCTPPPCNPTTCSSPAQVNQSSAAILDQSSAAILDGNSQYKAFGHGTMVMGIVHLVAPTAMLMPLKAFHSDGTASLSDILRAIYYGVQNSANVINMSFDTKTSSVELQKALDYANQRGVICAASSGNDGQGPPLLVYPAAVQSDVMGVASTSDQDTRSSFSNYGSAIVWVAAPGESIVSTYPFDTYAAGWGTSFSAPFVSGGAALLHNLKTTIAQSEAGTAVSHAVPLADPGMGHGRLDLCLALGWEASGSCSQDYLVSATPPTQTITAGQQANFTVSAAPLNGSTQTVIWSCTGAPAAATCTVSPSSVMLNGSTAATATVTLTTKARAFLLPLGLPRSVPLPHLWATLSPLFAALAVLLIVCSLGRASWQRPGLAAAAGILAVSLYTYSCGGYGNGNPPPGSATLLSVGVNPTSVTGGSTSTGTVTLSRPASSYGATVNLSSSASAATVPSSVTVAGGASSANFTVSTIAVSASTPVTITASYAGVTKTASLTVMPAQTAPTLSSLTLNPTSVTGGAQSSTGTVSLSGPAPTGGAQVLLSSDHTAASVPASVTVAAGASSANFMVSTSPVTVSTPVNISASYAGVTKTATLTVMPAQTAPTLSSLTLNPTSVTGGSSSTGTVTLSGPAPSGGAQVLLSSDNGAASVPSTVTLAAGASSATFTVSTSAVTVSTPANISASYAGVTKTAPLTVTPPGTPAGTYTLTITGTSGNLSHATTVQVIVN